MKEVRKKSTDPAVNQLLIKAYHQKDELVWDRTDAMQPQCGFGRLAICCTDCYAGPCRVNPFDALDKETACGKDKHDLAAGSLMRRVQDGACALLQLALDRDAALDKQAYGAVCFSADVMACACLADCLTEAGKGINALLTALSRTSDEQSQLSPVSVAVNMGALRVDAANIVIIGHAHPECVIRLTTGTSKVEAPVNMVSICGNEGRGTSSMSLLTNYDAQELPLLTGAVDLLVYGSQCVMPATLRLADRLGVPMLHAASSLEDNTIEQALLKAVTHFHKRGANVDIPAYTEQASVSFPPASIQTIAHALRAAYAKNICKGVVYLGGCGNIRHTQDADLVALAQLLLKSGYMIATSGCAGTALAKAGLCRADCDSPLAAVLPTGVPPVLHLGACHEALAVQELATALDGLPIVVAMPELTHSKTLAVAVALGAAGLPVFVSAAAVPGLSADDMGKVLTPLEDFSSLAQVLTTVGRS